MTFEGSEREKMIHGSLYLPEDSELSAQRIQTRLLLRRFNESEPTDASGRASLLGELLASAGPGLEIEPPFFCDYGWNTHVGSRVFMNFGCIILDCAPVHIGDDVQFGPGVHIYTATHPTDPVLRRSKLEFAKPVSIGDGAWLGGGYHGGTIVLPGVTIGANATIGAGSVVTRDVPQGVVAAGNPCRILAARS